eukprot:gnl/Chilomastix_caulleri/579.p1 GENE.gnl/Chilomastix_caulleri/579~~gnl/Chilomastix_caulleri/579.p1  ORF type:complete len:185 (+),score=36.80 gnl/Chilomastix_caulleri/579:50-604(+)
MSNQFSNEELDFIWYKTTTYAQKCGPLSGFPSSLGVAFSISLACVGSAYGTAKSGIGLMMGSVQRPENAMKNTLPVIMAGILGIYGLITGIAITTSMKEETSYTTTLAHFGAGLCTGLSALAAGFAIGISGNAGVRAVSKDPSLYVTMILILVFGEALALYGVIVSLILALTSSEACPSYNPEP